MQVLYPAQIGICMEMLVFVEGGKSDNPEKNPRAEQGENQQQTQPT